MKLQIRGDFSPNSPTILLDSGYFEILLDGAIALAFNYNLNSNHLKRNHQRNRAIQLHHNISSFSEFSSTFILENTMRSRNYSQLTPYSQALAMDGFRLVKYLLREFTPEELHSIEIPTEKFIQACEESQPRVIFTVDPETSELHLLEAEDGSQYINTLHPDRTIEFETTPSASILFPLLDDKRMLTALKSPDSTVRDFGASLKKQKSPAVVADIEEVYAIFKKNDIEHGNLWVIQEPLSKIVSIFKHSFAHECIEAIDNLSDK